MYIVYYVTAARASPTLQHNAFPFQQFGLFFPSLLFFTVPFFVAFRGDAHCTGGTNGGRRRNSERGPPLRSPCRYANTLFGPRLLAVLRAVRGCFVVSSVVEIFDILRDSIRYNCIWSYAINRTTSIRQLLLNRIVSVTRETFKRTTSHFSGRWYLHSVNAFLRSDRTTLGGSVVNSSSRQLLTLAVGRRW